MKIVIFVIIFIQHVGWKFKMDNSNNIKDSRISRKEILNLLSSMNSDISTHSLSMWLKSITNDEWVVVPRDFASMLYTLEGIANSCSVQDQGKAKDYLAQLKQYL